MSDTEYATLAAELAVDRRTLLATVSTVDQRALGYDTRNAGWTVQTVLAHVLAADADLIAILEASAANLADVPISTDAHEQEMARWATATPREIARQLGERGDRWRQLLAELQEGRPEAMATTDPCRMAFEDRVRDWRGHDAQHEEDVRLAIEADSSPSPP